MDVQVSVQSLELPDLGLLIVWDFHIMEDVADTKDLGATDEIAVAVIIRSSLGLTIQGYTYMNGSETGCE